MKKQLSRRAFLRASSDAARGSCLVLTMPMILTACRRAEEAVINEEEFLNLSEEEVAEYAAIAARIIPTDETPGATEAGVIYFIDQVLGHGREQERLILQEGLRELQAATALKPSASYFHELDELQQDHLLLEFEDTEFFGTIRYLTIAGMFSSPEYRGNRDNIGFDLLGFEDRHAWASPYGYYDADYVDKGE